MTAVRYATHVSTFSPDWFQNALILYDICWSMTAALIHLCAGSQKQKEPYIWTLADEAVRLNGLNRILTTRFKVLFQIYNGDRVGHPSGELDWLDEQVKTLPLLGIHPLCSQDECRCFHDDRASIQNPVSVPFSLAFSLIVLPMTDLILHLQRYTQGGQQLPARVNKHLSAIQYLSESETALKQLQMTLIARTAAHLDCNGEMQDLSRKLDEYLHDWYPISSHPTAYETKRTHAQNDFYVISCPELHPLPAGTLFEGLVDTLVEGNELQVRFANSPSDRT